MIQAQLSGHATVAARLASDRAAGGRHCIRMFQVQVKIARADYYLLATSGEDRSDVMLKGEWPDAIGLTWHSAEASLRKQTRA